MTKSQVLKQYFGYDSFRPGQAEIIDHVLQGGNALVLMPTGGGKSLCYQVPALMYEGLTIVVSPLIALMQDQVSALKANGVAAAFINSSQHQGEQEDIFRQCKMGELKILYLAPERLLSGNMLSFLQTCNIKLIAIDEAHCISQWGHDFRPEYRQLHTIRQHLPQAAVLALTATADRTTRRDMLSQLQMPDAMVHIGSFDRPNLSLQVQPGRERMEQIVAFANARPGQAGIVYCLSRKSVESVKEGLEKRGFKVAHYHAGLSHSDRLKAQQDFLNDDVQIIVATVAFGMGIDKSNIRWVIHYNLPPNVESFYQEIGRAGRDGVASDTVLFYSYQDVIQREDMIRSSEISPEQRDVLQSKLDRMKQYAEAEICRRRVLLSYFNEDLGRDCGHCDVCHHPPQRFDGTVLAQKALSAIARTNQHIGSGMLIDILRGSQNQQVVKNGYDQLPTYGVGRDLSYNEWLHYIHQMLNSGVVDIAYDEGNTLKLNALSNEVLKKMRSLPLTRYVAPQKREKVSVVRAAPVYKSRPEDLVLEALTEWRKQMADSMQIAPYNLLSDATLQALSEQRPIRREALAQVSGMSQERITRFGKDIIAVIADCALTNGFKIVGLSYYETLRHFQQKKSIETIAELRGLTPSTIFNHLVKLREQGEDIPFEEMLSEKKRKDIIKMAYVLGVFEEEATSTPLFTHFEGVYKEWEVRLALIMERTKVT